MSSAPISAFYSVADSDPERQRALYAMLFGMPLVWAVLASLFALSRPLASPLHTIEPEIGETECIDRRIGDSQLERSRKRH